MENYKTLKKLISFNTIKDKETIVEYTNGLYTYTFGRIKTIVIVRIPN